MARKDLFRVGTVSCYLRGGVWYMRYQEHGRRRQVRAGTDRGAVRRLASEINTQLEFGTAAYTSFEPISIVELRQRWLEHHERVLRSSVATINRYHTATRHLIAYIETGTIPKRASHFAALHAERFVHHLRDLKVAPNGHENASKRPLRDKGIKYILEVCRSMFNFAIKRRHLPPYADNPFSLIDIDRIPIEDAKPFIDLTRVQQSEFLAACDDWSFPIFVTLMLTGLRPGELTHLLLPDDLDLKGGWLHVRNKPDLGWQVKTRSERTIPLSPELIGLLEMHIRGRQAGPVFLRRCCMQTPPPLIDCTRLNLQSELAHRTDASPPKEGESVRNERQRQARNLWRDMGAIKPDKLRESFMRLTTKIGIPEVTAPKTLRHMFATMLQDANVDPLIRNQLMGHSAAGAPSGQGGLGMTSVYTHTRPETLRKQLQEALAGHPAIEEIQRRSRIRRTG